MDERIHDHPFDTPRERLYLPFLSPFYGKVAQPLGWLGFRLAIGLPLLIEGWHKVQAPMALSGFVESMGFHPGWLFSPLLAVVNFLGGLLIVLGLWTRPAALANGLMLLVTLWFHMSHPYGDAFLTAEGIEYLNANPELLTQAGQTNLLRDGGASFLNSAVGVQLKAEYASLFWAAGACIIAALGGGWFSLDRWFRKEF